MGSGGMVPGSRFIGCVDGCHDRFRQACRGPITRNSSATQSTQTDKTVPERPRERQNRIFCDYGWNVWDRGLFLADQFELAPQPVLQCLNEEGTALLLASGAAANIRVRGIEGRDSL